MSRIVICEKPEQVDEIHRAVGEAYGKVYPCRGYLLRLAAPEEINPEWTNWACVVLKLPGFYPWRPDDAPGKPARLSAIAKALKTASVVTLATDSDREGQLIGQSVLEYCGYRGKVMRAIFNAMDPVSLRKAFENLRPNDEFRRLYAAAVARQQSDQVYNLSLTRAATVTLREPGARGAIGIGRVKTATLAIAARRELAVLEFKPTAYYEVAATARTEAGSFRMRHSPDEGARILSRADAETVAEAAEGAAGRLSVTRSKERRRPPKLLDLPGLQKRCGGWGWTADKTLAQAQALYEKHKLTTYPRSEAAFLAESQIEDVGPILASLAAAPDYTALIPAAPTTRTGKNGHFCDSCLASASHHAVVPNVNGLDGLADKLGALSQDERRLFDLIARSYIAAVLPDHEYEATTAALDVAGAAFTASGKVVLAVGWRAAWLTEDEEEGETLPAIADGQEARLDDAAVEDKQTRGPARFHEGGLIEAMQAAWKFVDDPDLAERLKGAKGIGTPATRASIIEGLKAQDMLTTRGKHIVPTETGLGLYHLLADNVPALVDPGTTARWELRLDDILTGAATAEEVVEEIAASAAGLIDRIRACARHPSPGGARPPTEKMRAAAKAIAKAKGIPLPEGAAGSFAVCKEFLDTHADASGPPSANQIAFAEKLAAAAAVALPEEARTDRSACSAFIDAHKAGKVAGPKTGAGKRRPPPSGRRKTAGRRKS